MRGALFLLREAAGALGDLGTFVPLAVGMVQVAHLDAGTLLVTSGAASIWAGLMFRVPMAVQPMKAICALAIAGALSGEQSVMAGLSVGILLAALALLGLVNKISRVIPEAVVRALQLTVAAELLVSGVRFSFSANAALMSSAILFLWLLRRRLECAAIGLLIAGLGLAAWGTPELLRAPQLVLWRPQWMHFDLASLQGIWRGGVPQLPLTLLNSVLAVSVLSAQLYPKEARRSSTTRMALSVGLMNLVVCPLGGMPVCHGSGGLAGQHKVGARSGVSMVLLGGVKLALGLLLGGMALTWMRAFPRPVLGLFLLLAGWSLAEASRAWQTRSGVWAAAVMVAVNFTTGSLPVAFLAGWAACWVEKRRHEQAEFAAPFQGR